MPFLSGVRFLIGSHCKLRPNTEGREQAKIDKMFGDIRKDGKYPTTVGPHKVAHVRDLTVGHGARVSDRNLHSRMPLDPTHVRLKRCHACDQWHSSRKFALLPVDTVNCVATLKVRLVSSRRQSVTTNPVWEYDHFLPCQRHCDHFANLGH
jgi:hypothetical protein